MLRPILVAIVLAVLVIPSASCGERVEIAGPEAPSGAALRVLVGGEGYRDVLEFVARSGLAAGVTLELVDAPERVNAALVEGSADLAFAQTQPAFLGDRQANGYDTLGIAAHVDVAPYALYSSRWADLAPTDDWVNTPLGGDRITGRSLPHGAEVAVPRTPAGFARALYLLQSAGLLELDRPFGGLTAADLTVTEANIVDSPRHLRIRALDMSEYAADILANYDAVVFDPVTATGIGLAPARDALAVEPGPGNPYARVLVAPARLAGDPRLTTLAHALEGPAVADYLNRTYAGRFISAQIPLRPE